MTTSLAPPEFTASNSPAHLIDKTITQMSACLFDTHRRFHGATRAPTEAENAFVLELQQEFHRVHQELIRNHCPHQWISLVNQYVHNGSTCHVCGMLDPRTPEDLLQAFPGTTLYQPSQSEKAPLSP